MMPEVEVVPIVATSSVTSTVNDKEEDETKPPKKKPRRAAPSNPKKEDQLAKELAKRSETVVNLQKKLEKAEEELRNTIVAKKKMEQEMEELRKAAKAQGTTKGELVSLKNDLMVFYATKYDSLEAKEKAKTSLHGSIPMAIRQHFTKEDFKSYGG